MSTAIRTAARPGSPTAGRCARHAGLRLALLVVLVLVPGLARAFDTRARAAYVYDMTTGTVLLEKAPDVPIPPASMAKLMTVDLLFEALRDGTVTLETRFGVSARAAAMGGSSMFLDTTDRPTVEELIQGIIVLSGNDACVAVAEGLGGTEAAFAEKMTERAKMLGLTNSHFVNASGWPDPDQHMTVRDLAVLAEHLIREYPEYYGYFAEQEFLWDGRTPENRYNRNPLLKLGIGADGMKTGHTSEAGYGLVGSAVQGERRIVFVVSGLPDEKARAEEAEAIVNWAFRQFVQKTVAEKGKVLAQAAVWLGAESSVGLVPAEDIKLLIPSVQRDAVPGRVLYNGPIEAPVTAGQELGALVVSLAGMPDHRVPLVADRDIAKGGLLPRMKTAAGLLWKRYIVGSDTLQAQPVSVPTPAAADPGTAAGDGPAGAPAPDGSPAKAGAFDGDME